MWLRSAIKTTFFSYESPMLGLPGCCGHSCNQKTIAASRSCQEATGSSMGKGDMHPCTHGKGGGWVMDLLTSVPAVLPVQRQGPSCWAAWPGMKDKIWQRQPHPVPSPTQFHPPALPRKCAMPVSNKIPRIQLRIGLSQTVIQFHLSQRSCSGTHNSPPLENQVIGPASHFGHFQQWCSKVKAKLLSLAGA